jgi:predicted TIM-barrel fold metal-dependent hydrolase
LVVDAHVHLRELADGRRDRVGAEQLVRQMDASGIDAAVVIPLPGAASNEFVRRECAPFGDRLVTLYLPDFSRESETLARMERFFAESEPRGIKVHPRLQKVRPDDTIVHEVVGWALGRGLPVLFDVFPHGASIAEPGLQPAAYQRLADRFGDGTIVLAHAGGYLALQAFMVAKARPNVVLESSFTLAYFRGASASQDLAFAIRHLWPGRTMYGSDYPEVGLTDHLELTRQCLSGLSEDRALAFYGRTAAAVYRIRS